MRCIITGVETENKWKDKPVSTDAIKAARKFQELEPGLTLRQALAKLDKMYFKMIKNNAKIGDESCKEQEEQK